MIGVWSWVTYLRVWDHSQICAPGGALGPCGTGCHRKASTLILVISLWHPVKWLMYQAYSLIVLHKGIQSQTWYMWVLYIHIYRYINWFLEDIPSCAQELLQALNSVITLGELRVPYRMLAIELGWPHARWVPTPLFYHSSPTKTWFVRNSRLSLLMYFLTLLWIISLINFSLNCFTVVIYLGWQRWSL